MGTLRVVIGTVLSIGGAVIGVIGLFPIKTALAGAGDTPIVILIGYGIALIAVGLLALIGGLRLIRSVRTDSRHVDKP